MTSKILYVAKEVGVIVLYPVALLLGFVGMVLLAGVAMYLIRLPLLLLGGQD
jgi:hypothetical protein